jgi:hypothetical protein
MAKKYRILQGFNYKGKDGKSEKAVRLGPGEEVPELDSNEREYLLRKEIICEVSENGENIRYKKLIDLDDEQIENLMKKAKPIIFNEIKNVMYSKDTLSKIYALVDQRKMGQALLDLIEQKISGEI